MVAPLTTVIFSNVQLSVRPLKTVDDEVADMEGRTLDGPHSRTRKFGIFFRFYYSSVSYVVWSNQK